MQAAIQAAKAGNWSVEGDTVIVGGLELIEGEFELELRAADETKRLFDATVADYTRTLEIVRNQYAAGVAAKSDVAAAETQLQQAQAQGIDIGVQDAIERHGDRSRGDHRQYDPGQLSPEQLARESGIPPGQQRSGEREG